MDINNLNEQELYQLKNQIDERILVVKKEEEEKNNELKSRINTITKNKLSELKNGDRIYAIKIKPSDYDDPNFEWVTSFVGYGIINSCTPPGKDSKYYRLTIDGINKDSGIFLGISLDEQEINKHYLLYANEEKKYPPVFYTLKPDNWEEDLKDAFGDKIRIRTEFFNIQNDILKNKLESFSELKEVINSKIEL